MARSYGTRPGRVKALAGDCGACEPARHAAAGRHARGRAAISAVLRAAGFTAFEAYASLNGEAFYAALGFRRLEPIETPMPGRVSFPAVRMERAITPTPS